MKYLQIKSATSTELGECVLPTTPKPCRGCYEEVEVWKYDLKKWEENNASLPKLDTTCTLPAGEWFEGKRKTKYHYRGEWHNDIYGPQVEMDWANNGAKSQTFIVPVEQKDALLPTNKEYVSTFGYSYPRPSNRLDLMSPGERAIFSAMQEVEKIGASPELTNVVNVLNSATDLLYNYYMYFHEGNKNKSLVEQNDEPSRRTRLDLMTPAELAVHKAMAEVESLPADIRLTDAVILLGKAKDAVSNFVEGTFENGSYLEFNYSGNDTDIPKDKRLLGKVHGKRVATWVGGFFSMIPTKDISYVSYQQGPKAEAGNKD